MFLLFTVSTIGNRENVANPNHLALKSKEYNTLLLLFSRPHFLGLKLEVYSRVTWAQPRPQGAVPWLLRWGGSKAMEKRPGDEVDLGYVHIIPLKVIQYHK